MNRADREQHIRLASRVYSIASSNLRTALYRLNQVVFGRSSRGSNQSLLTGSLWWNAFGQENYVQPSRNYEKQSAIEGLGSPLQRLVGRAQLSVILAPRPRKL